MRATAPVLLALVISQPAAMAAQAQWRAVEDLRIGGSAPLAHIFDFQVARDGGIFVYNDGQNELHLFDATGKHVRQVGVRGIGDGQYLKPNGIEIAPDGRVWVNDLELKRWVIFKSNGDFDRIIKNENRLVNTVWRGMFDAQGRLLEDIGFRGSDGKFRQGLKRFAPTTGALDTLIQPPCSFPSDSIYASIPRMWRAPVDGEVGLITIPFIGGPRYANQTDGSKWCTEIYGYNFKGIAADGKAIATGSLNLPPVPISARVRDSAIAAIRAANSWALPDSIKPSYLPKNYLTFREMRIDDDGRIWLFRFDGTKEVADIWSRDGKQLATITMPISMKFESPFQAVGNSMYLKKDEGGGKYFVVRYKIGQ